MNSPCLISVVHLAYFVDFEEFLGVCRSFLPTKLDEIGPMDSRNQARSVYLLNFIQEK